MTHLTPPVFLASIALEPNRWKGGDRRVPSFMVSRFNAPAKSAGFRGWELWEPHFFLADVAEKERLRESPLPIRIFNTYLRPGIDDKAEWEKVVEAITFLGEQVEGVKFNLGKADSLSPGEQIEAALDWAEALPGNVRMLCENHPGTLLEEPAEADRAFQAWPSDRFGAILHPLAGEESHCSRWLEALPDRIEHLHWQARGPDNKLGPLADQGQKLDSAIAALRAAGFAGSQSIEFVEGTGQPGEAPESLFQAAAADQKILHSGWK